MSELNFINQLIYRLSNLSTTRNLINLYIFASIKKVTQCRKRSDYSNYYIFLFRKAIPHQKNIVITWLQKRFFGEKLNA